MAAEGPKAARAPNCNHPRFFLKTKDVCTRTAHGTVSFQSVKDRDALIAAFLPRLLVGDQIRDAPDGIYCWILRGKGKDLILYAMKVICQQEIGSLHNFIFLLSSGPGPLLEDGTFKDAQEVISAGELLVNGEERVFNLQSGSFMEPILGIKSCYPVTESQPKHRLYKTRKTVVEELRDNITKRNERVTEAAPYLSATFDSVPIPDVPDPLEKTAVTEYVKRASHALGGRSFIQDAEIMTSENNIGFLHSLMSTDLPASEERSHARPTKKAKQTHPKKGGARRTRKARRSHKKRMYRV